MIGRFVALCKGLIHAAGMMAGKPDYEAYKRHMRAAHPDRAALSYEEFVRNRQCARYGGNGGVGPCC